MEVVTKTAEKTEQLKAEAQVELKEFGEKVQELCQKYNCRFEAQIIINSKGVAPQVITVHNLLA